MRFIGQENTVLQGPECRQAMVEIGYDLGPEVLGRCQAMYRDELAVFARRQPPSAADLAYGPHPRQRLDLYAPTGTSPADGAPVMLFVHGGAFVSGDKRPDDAPFNAHVGQWAARHGFLGAVINYRLVPDAAWPSGGEDVAAAVDWLGAHAAAHGGDPTRIVLLGTSAGSTHIATSLQLRPAAPGVRAVALLSGIYGAMPFEAKDRRYFGDDVSRHASQASLCAVASSAVPLFAACAQFDPPRFQAETLALWQATLAARGSMPRAYVASGHNHYTMAMHLGSSDTRLADEILGFACECCR